METETLLHLALLAASSPAVELAGHDLLAQQDVRQVGK